MKTLAICGFAHCADAFKILQAQKVELPGHGASPFSSSTIRDFSKELKESFGDVEHLIGWSLGATVAVFLANGLSSLKKLTLISPTPSFCKISQRRSVCRKFLYGLRSDPKRELKEFWQLSKTDGGCFPDIKKALPLIEDFMRVDASAQMKRINVKDVKIFVEVGDKITKVSGAISSFYLIKGAQLHILNGESHLPAFWRWL